MSDSPVARRDRAERPVSCGGGLIPTCVLLVLLVGGPVVAVEEAGGGEATQSAHDDRAAPAELVKQAKNGSADAAHTLASAYYSGHGVVQNFPKALRLWQQAGALGHSEAAYNAGLLLRQPAARDEAHEMLRQAAAEGDILAAFVLGTRLAVAGEHQAAESLLASAAQAGYGPAQHNLARLLSDMPGRLDEARDWYAAAAPAFAPARSALESLPVTPETAAHLPALGSGSESESDGRGIHGVNWVRARPGEHYTIQVSAGRDENALKRTLERYAGAHDSAWFLHRPGAREPFSAIVGVFDDYASAESALAALPPTLKNNAPWIRRFATLQRELQSRGTDEASPANEP